MTIKYPKSITYAYQPETNYWRQIKNIQTKNNEGGLLFFNKKYVTCYNCKIRSLSGQTVDTSNTSSRY